jgi:pyrroline-5-carboxylate reductase
MDNYQIAIIGAGSMGGAILSGLVSADFDVKKIKVSTKSAASSTSLSTRYGISAISAEENPSANSEVVQGADVVVVAVKPQFVLEVLVEVSDSLKQNATVISVAAGITTASMEKYLPDSIAVIRAMPNTPSIFGLGVTGVVKGISASESELRIAKQLFETVGQVLVLEEDRINALSTISGSGPAYVFYFAEKLIGAALNLGFSKEEAEVMVRGTFLGASTLLVESGESPEELRRQVTSPNGTTMQAIAKFDEAKLDRIFQEATEAALARAVELGKVDS